MTWGFACSMTITSLPSTVLVATVCCELVSKVSFSTALARIRCTESMTSSGWAKNAFPSSVVHWMFPAIRSMTSGTATMD